MPRAEPESLPFRDGDIIAREFWTSRGWVDLLAEVRIEGNTLHLTHVAVYPRGDATVSLGTGEVLSIMRGALAAEAHGLGFDKLRISGTRLSGAQPGKRVDFTITLERISR